MIEDDMNRESRHVLVLGGERIVDRVAPMLRRAEFDVHTVPPSPFVLDLVTSTRFELLVVSYPLPIHLAMPELLASVRDPASASRYAGLLLVAEPGFLEAAHGWVDQGANRAVGLEWPDARLWQAVGDLLSVAPRVALRVLVETEVEVGRERGTSLCRSENVSVSGMLLRTADPFSPGSEIRFSFVLPDDGRLLNGSAEVVRRSHPRREGVEGFGVRFLRLTDDGKVRLESFIERHILYGEQGPGIRT